MFVSQLTCFAQTQSIISSWCRCTDWQRTCHEGGLVGVTAQSGDCSGNINDMISLLGVQASTVQVPGTNMWALSAPVSIVNPAHRKTCLNHTDHMATTGKLIQLVDVINYLKNERYFRFVYMKITYNIPAVGTGNNWTCTTPGHTGYMKTPLKSTGMLEAMKAWNLQTWNCVIQRTLHKDSVQKITPKQLQTFSFSSGFPSFAHQITVIFPVHLEPIKGVTPGISDQLSDDSVLNPLQEVLQARRLGLIIGLLEELLWYLVRWLRLGTADGHWHRLDLCLSTAHCFGLTASLKYQQIEAFVCKYTSSCSNRGHNCNTNDLCLKLYSGARSRSFLHKSTG